MSRRPGKDGNASAPPERRTPEFDEVADALYALPPSRFTAARNEAAEQAKRGGDRALAQRIGALRRPTAAAHALNLLVRAHPEQVEQLRTLGQGLREAQQQLQGPRLRELAAQRNALVTAVATQARREAAQAGPPLGGQAADELEQTLRAVLADEDAADRFAEGRLAQALTPGSTLPDLPATAPRHAAARPSTARTAEPDRAAEAERRRRAETEAEAEAEQERRRRETELRTAESALERARTQAERAAEQRRVSRERVRRAEQALEQAREALEAAEEKATASGKELAVAERRADQARAELEAQQVTLDRLHRT